MAENYEARIRALEAALLFTGRVSGNPSSQVTLKEHFEARISSLEKATTVAADAMDKRLDSMNEFRSTLKDQAGKFVTREELDLQISVNREAIDDLRTFKDRLEGRASAQSVYIAYAFSLVGIVLGVLSLLVK